MNVKPYRKAVAAIAGVVAVVAQATADGVVTAEETGLIVTSVVTAVGVFAVRNEDLPTS